MAIECTGVSQMSILRTRHFKSSLAEAPSIISNNLSLPCFTSSCSSSVVVNYDSFPPQFGLYSAASSFMKMYVGAGEETSSPAYHI